MPRWSRKRLRTVSTTLVATLTSLWLAGACAAVAMPCGSPCAKGDMSPSMAMPCEQATAACDLPSLNVPVGTALDFSVTPVLLTTVPFVFITETIVHAPPVSWQATRPPSTPLYLTHLALLN